MTAQITLTEQQLQTIIANSVAAALANVQASTPAITLNTHKETWEVQGDKGYDVEHFISQCDAYYALSAVQADKTQVISALGRLEGKAAEWAIYITDYIALHTGRLLDEVNTWAKFKELLHKYFGDATPEDKGYCRT